MGGRTDIADPLAIIERIDPKLAWLGLRLLMVSTTGGIGQSVLDAALRLLPADAGAITAAVARIARIASRRCAVLFGGQPGELRAG
jgi:hypothetical protein